MKKNLMLTNMKRLVMAVMLCAFALGGKAQTAVTINPSNRLQTVEGWGVSLCWWAAQAGQWDDAKINEIADWLVSPDGLNYNVFRYNIPGGDAPGHDHMSVANGGKGMRTWMAGFAETKEDFDNKTYKWENDEAQIKMMRAIIARAEYYGKKDQIMIEAFANTPPYWMTVSGCASGAETATDTNLPEANYEMFAEYLIDVCKHFKEVEGIEFYTLEPFNEPHTNYWGKGGGQEGCGFKPADQVKFIPVLYSKLVASGLNTVISASDETNEKLSKEAWDVYAQQANSAAMNAVTQWNSHSYGYNPGGISDATKRKNRNANRVSLRDAVAAQGKRLWMSETGEGGTGITGNLKLAETFWDDMNYLQPVVWCDWQAMETNDQWCIIECSGTNDGYTAPYWKIKNYYIRQQVTSNIKVGYTMLSTGNDQVLAAVNPERDEVVVCFLNTGTSNTGYKLNVSSKSGVTVKKATITDSSRDCADYTISNLSNFQVPKQSVVTIVLDGDYSLQMTDNNGNDIVFGDKYMLSTTKRVKKSGWSIGYDYPDYTFFAADDEPAVSSQEGFPSVDGTGFLEAKHVWTPELVGADRITLHNMKSGKYLGGLQPDLSASSDDAMTFFLQGPNTNDDKTPNYWVLEGETGNAYKYLNFNGGTVGNGFCFWTDGASDYGSNFRFHKLQYFHINAFVQKGDANEPVAFKLNDNDGLLYTGEAELYYDGTIAGKLTSFTLNQTLEGVVETKYILNGKEQASDFDVKSLKDGDVLDVVFVCEDAIPVTITTAQYATLYYSDKALQVPEGVEAYVYTYNDVNNNVESTAYKTGEVIPAGEAVLLHSLNQLSATTEFPFYVKGVAGEASEENLLKGTDVGQSVQDSNHNCYVLKSKDGHIAFYYATPDGNSTFVNGAHKAYLQLPATANALPAMIELDGETSGIAELSSSSLSSSLYNIAGLRVGKNYKGVVIRNGKKFVNK